MRDAAILRHRRRNLADPAAAGGRDRIAVERAQVPANHQGLAQGSTQRESFILSQSSAQRSPPLHGFCFNCSSRALSSSERAAPKEQDAVFASASATSLSPAASAPVGDDAAQHIDCVRRTVAGKAAQNLRQRIGIGRAIGRRLVEQPASKSL